MKTLTKTFATISVATTLTIGAVISAPMAFAQDYIVEDVRARPSLGVAKNSAAFFTIENPTDKADKLVSAESDVAKKVELHTHIKENNVFKMRPVESIDIPAHGKAVLQSGGLHVMLIGVHSKLKIGDKFKLKLNFEHGAPITISVPVQKMTGHKKMMHKKMDHTKMDHSKMDHKMMDQMKKKKTMAE